MNRTKTIGLVALAAGAAALLYRPTKKLITKIADKRRARRADDEDDHTGKFAGHYLGIKRHHGRNADRRKPVVAP